MSNETEAPRADAQEIVAVIRLPDGRYAVENRCNPQLTEADLYEIATCLKVWLGIRALLLLGSPEDEAGIPAEEEVEE